MSVRASGLLLFAAVGPMACAPPAAPTKAEASPPATTAAVAPHPGIRVGRALIEDIRAGKYDEKIYRFSSDDELGEPRRAAAFRVLAEYVASREWTVELASIQYSHGGVEDSIDLWLSASDGAWVALYVGYFYEAKEWRVDGYEFPTQTFNRKGMTLGAYVAASKEHLRGLPPSSAHKNGEDGAFRLVPAAQ